MNISYIILLPSDAGTEPFRLAIVERLLAKEQELRSAGVSLQGYVVEAKISSPVATQWGVAIDRSNVDDCDRPRIDLTKLNPFFCIIAGDVWRTDIYRVCFDKFKCPVFLVTGIDFDHSDWSRFQWGPSARTIGFCMAKLASKDAKECPEFYIITQSDKKGQAIKSVCKKTLLFENPNLKPVYIHCLGIAQLREKVKSGEPLSKALKLCRQRDNRVIVYGYDDDYFALLAELNTLKSHYKITTYGDINALSGSRDEGDAILVDRMLSTFVMDDDLTASQYIASYYSDLIDFCYSVIYRFNLKTSGELLAQLSSIRFYHSRGFGSVYFNESGGFCAPLFLWNRHSKLQNPLPCDIQCSRQLSAKEEIVQQTLEVGRLIANFNPESIDVALNIHKDQNRNSPGTKSLLELLQKTHRILVRYFGSVLTSFFSNYPNTVRNFYSAGDGKLGETKLRGNVFGDINVSRTIQINLSEQDIEDNGAIRVYAVVARGASYVIVPCYYVISTDQKIDKIEAIVLSQTYSAAEKVYKSYQSGAIIKDATVLTDGKAHKFIADIISLQDELHGVLAQSKIYAYLIPEYNCKDQYRSFVVLAANYKLSLFELQALETIISRIYSSIQIALRQSILRLTAIKSAIGSIMSRNGSHNIGSHVLAALTHSVGTMPDDRVLYQYIQHRMDYIATATTDRPQWRQPTMLVSCLVKEFLKQRHLLDHISGSEGLRAYRFQWQTRVAERYDNEIKELNDEQHATIRVHVRRVCPDAAHAIKDTAWEGLGFLGTDEKRNIIDFIDYDRSEMQNLSLDLSLAIPGGVVGHHAFYTIIENVLRNAAKHEWAEAMRVWKIAKLDAVLGEDLCRKEFLECRPQHLDLYIDFRDNPYSGKVEFRIWNNRVISATNTARIRTAILRNFIDNAVDDSGRAKLRAAVKILLDWHRMLCKQKVDLPRNPLFLLINSKACRIDKKGKMLQDDEIQAAIVEGLIAGVAVKKGQKRINRQSIYEFIYEALKQEDIKLAEDLTQKIKLSFIDEKTGGLRRENWGIAEMRISVGFLQCRKTAHIGGLADADSPLTIIRPVLVNNQDEDKCIAYRFDVDTPKLLLVILTSPCDNLDEINANAARYGVRFMARENLRAGKAYSYSYILFEHLDETWMTKLKSREIMLPFRNLCASSERDDTVLNDFVPKYTGAFFDKSAGINTLEWLIQHPDGTEDVSYALLESVYADWMRHVQSHGLPRGNGCPKLVLDVGDQDSTIGSAQTLISNFELLKFVFENTLNAAIRSFLKENGPTEGTGSLKAIDGCCSVDARNEGESSRENEKTAGEGEIVSLPKNVAAVLLSIAQLKRRTIATKEQLAKELRMSEQELLTCPPAVVDAQLRLWIRKDVIGENSCVKVLLDDSDPELKKIWGAAFKNCDEINIDSLQSLYDDELCYYWFFRFINYIATVALDQADSFLRKYEERFATLPRMPKTNEISVRGKRCVSALKIGGTHLQKIILTGDANERTEALKARDICYFRHGKDIQNTIGDVYYEPLSGAQSTMNAFMSFRQDLANVAVELSQTQSKDIHCRTAGFAARLIENASFRILIVDERVKKFMNDHSDVADVLRGLRIAVADDTDSEVIQMFSADFDKNPPKFSGVDLIHFEIVIIHQGVIDKLLSGHDDKRVVEAWMNRLIEKLHYVVITTGRGSPANIPDSARVLPYSVIESSILQRFPEKLILVDAVMNILPVRQHEEDENV